MFVRPFLCRCGPFLRPSPISARLTRTQQWKTQILIRSISNNQSKQDTPAVATIQVPSSWVEHLPAKARPYLYLTRVDKPIGTLLLFYPCGRYTLHGQLRTFYLNIVPPLAWSIMMGSYALQLPYTAPLTYISVFGLGALFMRGAGCTINDMWDKNLDKSVGASLVTCLTSKPTRY